MLLKKFENDLGRAAVARLVVASPTTAGSEGGGEGGGEDGREHGREGTVAKATAGESRSHGGHFVVFAQHTDRRLPASHSAWWKKVKPYSNSAG